mmetsp:Transcript_3740/g.11844  ORF Transcript_3740/g.11844 Transcript_3740/m.11844 type:complete len:200 (+) Transcript_3740:226-825(+)
MRWRHKPPRAYAVLSSVQMSMSSCAAGLIGFFHKCVPRSSLGTSHLTSRSTWCLMAKSSGRCNRRRRCLTPRRRRGSSGPSSLSLRSRFGTCRGAAASPSACGTGAPRARATGECCPSSTAELCCGRAGSCWPSALRARPPHRRSPASPRWRSCGAAAGCRPLRARKPARTSSRGPRRPRSRPRASPGLSCSCPSSCTQ